jgi:ABC-type branched-subunit amino acid transport system substrate-binding protein
MARAPRRAHGHAVRVIGLAAGCISICVGLLPATSSEAASSYPAIPKGNITVGLSESLSGNYAPDGLTDEHNIENAYKIVAQDFGVSVDGHKIVLDFQNDGSDITTAVDVAQQFVSNHVAAVLNASSDSSAAEQQVPVWNKAHLPMLLNNTPQDQYTNAKAYPYLFNVLPSNTETALSMAQWIAAKHLTKIAVMTDGTSASNQVISDLKARLEKADPKAKVVGEATVTPGAVDVSTQLDQLKATNPDLLYLGIGYGFGSVWNDLQTLGWTPTILTNEGAFFDGYTALGSLGPTTFSTCADGLKSGETLPSDVVDAINSDIKADGNLADQLIFVQVNMDSLLIIKAAIAKYHSTAPAAIKAALESFHDNSFFWKQWVYRFTSSNHFGFTGERVCDMSPLGQYRIPVIDNG